jgi:hypothetical protein
MQQKRVAQQLTIAKEAIDQAENALQEGEAEAPGYEKVTFYLTPGQVEKLDDLVHDYRKRTGKRINRTEIIRFLVEHARLETLLAEW